jgi:Mitochondrial carrier protein
LFVAQTRLINQHRNFKVFTGISDIIKQCGIRSMWAGWGSIIPRQVILSIWSAYIPALETYIERVLGSSSELEILIREILIGIGGYVLVYPLITASRRVAAYGTAVGMSTQKYSGFVHALWRVSKDEGVKTLFRGLGAYSIAVICN